MRPKTTISWLNVSLSVEAHLQTWLDTIDSDIPLYRADVPKDVAEQRAYCPDKAVFFGVHPGDITDFQDTYVDITICQTHSEQQFLPSANLHGIWLHETERSLQAYLNEGDADRLHLFPLYNYDAHLSTAQYNEFMSSGDVSDLMFLRSLSPAVIEGTGFIIRAGHAGAIQSIMNENPRKITLTTVWQHWSPDVYSAQRG